MADPAKNGQNAEFLAQAGKGRPKGVPNKTTALLKDAIIQAAIKAGGEGDDGGLVGYLIKQANDYPKGFLPLLGKVLPMQLVGDADNPVHHSINISGLSEATLREIAAQGVK